jgi:hypothetical protein
MVAEAPEGGRLRSARAHVAPPPTVLAVFRMPVPAARRSLMAASTFALTFGRTSFTPRALALARPALTRLDCGATHTTQRICAVDASTRRPLLNPERNGHVRI